MSKIEKALQRARATGGQNGGDRALVHVQNQAEGQVQATALVSLPGAMVPAESTEQQHQDSLGSIARMREPLLLDRDELARRGIIYPEISEDRTVKAFREIRTKIVQQSQGKNCVLLVVSPTDDDSATFVTVNLAAAFAFSAGQTALVVDCNFRRGSMHRYFDVEGRRGLTDYLEDNDCDVSEVIYSVGVPRLRVIPAGTRRDVATECFTTARMKTLLKGARSRYRDRYILLDAAPMTSAADTQILADLCDYIVVVVPYGKLTATQIEDSLKGLDRRKVIGMVFNNEPYLPGLGFPSVKELVGNFLDDVRFWLEGKFGRIKQTAMKLRK